ncbi:MAG TPA: class I SAM-dependent methyltransferase [Sphingomicrobium sp.]|nr:class I SAM-dependent methyltransferase [Sphingomicrobium sp.]
MTASSFTDLFSGNAQLYADARPTYPASLIGELAALAPARGLAWDSGTGNGQAARALAEHFAQVHATDASPQQIQAADPAERVHFAVEPAEHCSLADSSVDLVLAAQSMHWYDLDRFYAEATRVLRPGGLLAAIGYGWFYVDPTIDEIVGRSLLKRVEPHWAPGNWLLIDGYRTIAFPGKEVRLTPAAIHLVWRREQFEAYVRSWSVVQRLGEEVTAEGFAKLAQAWPDDEPRHVTMPIVSRAARL